MGAAGRQRFEQCFTYTQFAARIVPLLLTSFDPGQRVLGRTASQTS